MKTPRDILFARHEAAAPKLDAIRRTVVDELNNQGAKTQSQTGTLVASLLGCSNKLWLELVWPCRRIWIGLAAVWVLLIIVNVSQRDDSHTLTAKSLPPAGMMMAYRDQEKLLNELLADRSEPTEAARLQKFVPKPRSETSGTAAV